MPIPVPLTVTTEPDGGWTVVVPRPPNEPARARIEPEQVATFLRESATALEAGKVAVAARALHELLALASDPWRELATTLRAVTRANRLAVVCVQASGSAVEAPWELLNDSQRQLPLEVRGEAVIVRLVPNSTRPLDRAAKRLRLRHPPLHPDEKTYGAKLHGICQAAGVPSPVPMRLGQTPADEALVLLLKDDLPQEVVWQRVIDHARLAVVTEGGPERLVEQGLAVVTGPTTPFPTLLELSFLETLVETLAGGAPLLGALAAARRAIRKQKGPWWSWRIAVGGTSPAVGGPLVITRWQPEDWPQPASDVVEVLRIAREEGEAVGFVGLEHLLTAFDQAELRFGERAKKLRSLVGASGGQAWSALSALQPTARASDFGGSPRLRFLGTDLSEGFDAEALAGVLMSEPALLDLLEEPQPASPGVDARAPRLLEVLGGPEDGRVLEPQAGEVIGRAGKDRRAQHGLYEASKLTDRQISREAMIWGNDGRVHLRFGGQVLRDGHWLRLPPGETRLAVGDVLKLSPATRLRVLA